MCANQRKAGKRKAGLWLTPEEWSDLEKAALELGISKSDLLKRAIQNAVRVARVQKEVSNGKGK